MSDKRKEWTSQNHSRNIVGPAGEVHKTYTTPQGRKSICHMDAGLSTADRVRYAQRIIDLINGNDPNPAINDAVVLAAARMFCGGGLARCTTYTARTKLLLQVRRKLEIALREGV